MELMADSYFVDDRHALYVGWVLGIAHRNGIPAEPVADDNGNWTDTVRIPMPADGLLVDVIVPPPPADWKLDPADAP